MKAQDLKKGQRFWCWWLSRDIYFVGKNTRTNEYRFEDIADVPVYLTEEDLGKLEERA